jgi:hypothetical protein
MPRALLNKPDLISIRHERADVDGVVGFVTERCGVDM